MRTWLLAALMAAWALHGAAVSSAVTAGPAPGGAASSAASTFSAFSMLPPGTDFDPAVPAPEAVFGFAPGERHVRPDQLVRYAELLAAASDRVTLEIQGETWEGRPQPLLVITSPANHRRLEEIRLAHLALGDPDRPAPGPEALAAMPAVVLLAYSIHGNEASGANAAPAVAYWLAAARGPEVEALLARTVVLLDPSQNPDGLGRFATWANSHWSAQPVADRDHREHLEAWPGGRTNHYGFDLNRDWLLLQQPESRARVATLRRWRPNLIGDYHEMGGDRTYFFQPGVSSRQNPLIPEENQRLSARIAAYHAAAFDAAGRLYYTEEDFDDFYPGKGSTYPDLTGGVGVLFEEASARGRLLDTVHGPLTLRFAIENQLAASRSMLAAARDLRLDLLAYQARFVHDGLEAARRDPVAAWVFATPGDPARAFRLLEVLDRHGIEVFHLARAVEAGGLAFAPEESWLVPVEQPQARLVRALFERVTSFADSTFYDVSAWTLPLAFGARVAEIGRADWQPALRGEPAGEPAFPRGRLPAAAAAPTSPTATPYAYLLSWRGAYAPRALYRLLAAGYRAAVATRPFAAETDAGRRRFAAGTLVVPVSGAAGAAAAAAGDAVALADRVRAVAAEDAVDVYAVAGGLTAEGIDLGSPKVVPLVTPKPLLVVGGEVSAGEAGEVWHLLDQRVGMPLPLVEIDRLAKVDLTPYTHVLMVDGDYAELAKPVAEALGRWVRRGGVVVASQRAAKWAFEHLLTPPAAAEGEAVKKGGAAEPAPARDEPAAGEAEPREHRPYADFEADRQAKRITGAIFTVDLDLTHPLAFGIDDPTLPVLRESIAPLTPSKNPYETVARYGAAPLLSGYASEANLKALAGGPALVATRLGKGTVVRFADDANFRAVWYGTQKLYLNALFFAAALEATEPDKP